MRMINFTLKKKKFQHAITQFEKLGENLTSQVRGPTEMKHKIIHLTFLGLIHRAMV